MKTEDIVEAINLALEDKRKEMNIEKKIFPHLLSENTADLQGLCSVSPEGVLKSQYSVQN